MTTPAKKAFTYNQKTGELIGPEGAKFPDAYSGHGAGVNNPDMEAVSGVGPIPRGDYRIGDAYDHPRLGNCVMPLTPVGHDAHGRTGFFMHGDNSKMNRSASHGCIIEAKSGRLAISKSDVKLLSVV